MIVFACFSPHAPILLPSVGSSQDRVLASKTIGALELLGQNLAKAAPDEIIISSPHQDWGFNVPLHFLAKNFKGKIVPYLIGLESPSFYFEEGKRYYELKIKNSKLKIGLIASGDTSHCLKEDGPYGFHPDGPQFDQELIKCLKEKDVEGIFKLEEKYPQAADCGLRSFCFVLGILAASGLALRLRSGHTAWQPEILSYESPWGVGYLVVNFTIH